MRFIDPPSELPDLGKECYYVVMDGTRKRILLSGSKPTDKVMTLMEFCERGLELYSDRPMINRSRELALLNAVISKHGRTLGPGATTALYQLMDELSKSFKTIRSENGEMSELNELISLHRSHLGGFISRTEILPEALNIIKKGRWFAIDEIYIETYPFISEAELEIIKALDLMAGELFIASPEPPRDLGSGKKVSPEINGFYGFADRSEELEFVTRSIIGLNLNGVSFDSIAIVTPGADYLPAMEEMLKEYSVPYTLYASSHLRDTKTFDFIAQLVNLWKNDFRVSDIIDLFSSPLVYYEKLNMYSIKKLEGLLAETSGGIDAIAKSVISEKKADEEAADLADTLVRALRAIETSAMDPTALMKEFHLPQSIVGRSSRREAEHSLRREMRAYEAVVKGTKDLSWASDVVGLEEKDFLNSLINLLHDSEMRGDSTGGVAILLDKSGFWGGFERSFYCGVNMNSLSQTENPLITGHEAEIAGVLDKRDEAEMRKRLILGSMKGNAVVSCVLNPESKFSVFDALGLEVERRDERVTALVSKTDFEHALAGKPGLIEFAEEFGKDYSKRMERAVENRDRFEHGGILECEVEIREISPGALEHYVKCPFYFFVRDLLGLGDPGLEARENMEWGSAMHDAMKNLYTGETYIHAIRGTDLFFTEGKRRIEASLHHHSSDPYIGVRVNRGLKNSFPLVLDIENGLKGRPTMLERKLSKKISDVELRGRVDRIDIDEGKPIVYDYKSNGGNFSRKNLDLMQIPLYLWMVDGLNGGGYYYIITDREGWNSPMVELKNFFKGSETPEVIREIVDRRVPAIIKSIKRGFFPPKYLDRKYAFKECDSCEVRGVCYLRKKMKRSFPFGEYVEQWREQHGRD